MTTRIAFVLGTRPEIIKLAPVIRECERRDVPYVLIHTGQHYSEGLDEVFFDQLELPAPDYDLAVGSDTHGRQTAEMLTGIEAVLSEVQPDVVLVQGDTNSVLAGALATSKAEPDLAHVEAGLRSFDRSMPEEVNRIVADNVADYLLAPTEQAAEQLAAEGVPADRIHHTGNPIVDAVHQHREIAERKSTVREDLGLDGYGVLTVHRAANVDDRSRFADVLDGVDRAAGELGIEVVYPVHPRARERLDADDLRVPDRIRLVDPLDYLDFLTLQRHAEIVVTDSGGVQEETCILGTPCVTVRDNTERPETLDAGSNRLVGTDPEAIRAGAVKMAERSGEWTNPFGDGTASQQILAATAERAEVAR